MLRSLLCWPMLLLLLNLLCPAAGFAHKVNIFAYTEGGTVYAESYFPNGQAVVNAKVQVFDSQQQLLLEGQTDEAGFFEFNLPKKDDLTLVIDAGMGHKNKFLLKKNRLRE